MEQERPVHERPTGMSARDYIETYLDPNALPEQQDHRAPEVRRRRERTS